MTRLAVAATSVGAVALLLAGCSSGHGGGPRSSTSTTAHQTPVTLGAPVTTTSTTPTTLPVTTTTLPKTVTGSSGGLTVSLTVDPVLGTAGKLVRFILQANETHAPGALHYSITYGDGGSGALNTPSVCTKGPGKAVKDIWNVPHTYAKPGTYTANVTVAVNCSPDKATASVSLTAVAQ
jgi:hypothetical protein